MTVARHLLEMELICRDPPKMRTVHRQQDFTEIGELAGRKQRRHFFR